MGVLCVIVDGPAQAVTALEAGGGVLRHDAVAGLSDLTRAITGKSGWLHTLRCAAVIQSVDCRITLRGVEAFPEQASETSAALVLDALWTAINLGPSVICVPSAIRETVLEEQFEKLCECARQNGIAIVCAWPRTFPRPLPAVFDSTIAAGQMVRSCANRPMINWDESKGAFQTPMSASISTALVSGLIALYALERWDSCPTNSTASLRDFTETCKSTEIIIPKAGGDRFAEFVFEEYAPGLGAAYRGYLEIQAKT